MSYEISLYNLLENKDKELCSRLPNMRNKAKSLLSYTSGKFPYYTPHDFSHSLNVEENLNWLVPDHLKEEMNPYELFSLITAAWLHDWGMVGEAAEDPNLIRDEHHIRTESNFERMYEKLNLSEHEARIIGRISKGHRKVDLNTQEYDDVVLGQNNKIRQRFLAALLRIADECDVTHNRTPEIIYHTINPTEQSEAEFKKHLSISGIGQLEEKHKIYISAIARDPKGARTLREVAQKIQSELDGVKGILALHGVNLDIVDLKLETRGFIDKPIGFEINKEKIVDLLIGDHLYANQDVSIRELIQNAIDTCKLKETLMPGDSCKIILTKDNKGTLVIEDNGLGMDYYEAKQFLSNIGTSLYKSKLLQDRLDGKSYSPISQYGIGILSCFLICNKVIIETLKEGHEACKFSVESVYEEWKYEKGHQKNVGTKITLELNEDGIGIKLKDSLHRYLLCPEVPIEYKDVDEELRTFEPAWTAEDIYLRFSRDHEASQYNKPSEILKINRTDYDVILGTDRNVLCDRLILFNHGIYVGQFPVEGLDYYYFVCINLKANLIDLHISREDVKLNLKWTKFIYSVFEDIFSMLEERENSDQKEGFISIMSSMLEDRFRFEIDSMEALTNKIPFMNSFLEKAYFPLLDKGIVKYLKYGYAFSHEGSKIYSCCSRSLSDELNLLSSISGDKTIVVNPYKFPFVIDSNENKYSFITFMLSSNNINNEETDLRDVLLDDSKRIDLSYPELLPDNVLLATFGHDLKPLVVVYKHPVVSKDHFKLGAAYWGNILLWKQLLDTKRISSYLSSIRSFEDDRYENMNIEEDPIVYVDYSDIFIKAILDKRKSKRFNIKISSRIYRYFKYLSYLPLVINNLSSCIIFLETIDVLESEIAESLSIPLPPSIFERMKPSCKLFLAYLDRYGLTFVNKES